MYVITQNDYSKQRTQNHDMSKSNHIREMSKHLCGLSFSYKTSYEATVFNKIPNQIFHYTCCTTPKLVMSLRGTFKHHCALATQHLLKKCCSGRESLATLCLS